MGRLIKLSEMDITRIVRRVIKEDKGLGDRKGELYSSINNILMDFEDVDPSDIVMILKNILDVHKAMEYRSKNKIEPVSSHDVRKRFKNY